jgi:hypothetical protein
MPVGAYILLASNREEVRDLLGASCKVVEIYELAEGQMVKGEGTKIDIKKFDNYNFLAKIEAGSNNILSELAADLEERNISSYIMHVSPEKFGQKQEPEPEKPKEFKRWIP